MSKKIPIFGGERGDHGEGTRNSGGARARDRAESSATERANRPVFGAAGANAGGPAASCADPRSAPNRARRPSVHRSSRSRARPARTARRRRRSSRTAHSGAGNVVLLALLLHRDHRHTGRKSCSRPRRTAGRRVFTGRNGHGERLPAARVVAAGGPIRCSTETLDQQAARTAAEPCRLARTRTAATIARRAGTASNSRCTSGRSARGVPSLRWRGSTHSRRSPTASRGTRSGGAASRRASVEHRSRC